MVLWRVLPKFAPMKQTLRAEMRRRKREYTVGQKEAMSEAICRHITDMVAWQEARCVLLYHPLPDEVDVRPLLEAGLDAGKVVILPQVVGEDLCLRLYTGTDSLSVGAFGIMEPTGALFVDYEHIDLAVIPGMAFDGAGHRLGRGKGYYDRLLPSLPHAHRIGVCFPFQFVDAVPSLPHDVTMHEVCC